MRYPKPSPYLYVEALLPVFGSLEVGAELRRGILLHLALGLAPGPGGQLLQARPPVDGIPTGCYHPEAPRTDSQSHHPVDSTMPDRLHELPGKGRLKL